MARPKIMDDGKITTVFLDKEDLVTIEAARGKTSVSAYIRSLVRAQQDPGEKDKTHQLEQKLQDAQSKLKVFEKKEKSMTKEMEDFKYRLAGDYGRYVQSSIQEPSQSQRENWILERCKGTGVKFAEAITLLDVNSDIYQRR